VVYYDGKSRVFGRSDTGHTASFAARKRHDKKGKGLFSEKKGRARLSDVL
jgi:hypothetical protein